MAVFFSAALTAQNSPELNIRFINSCIQSSVVLYLGIQCTNKGHFWPEMFVNLYIYIIKPRADTNLGPVPSYIPDLSKIFADTLCKGLKL